MSDTAVRARLRDVPQEVEDEVDARPRKSRRTPELLLGGLLILGGALTGLVVFQRDDTTVTVVATSRDLPRGTVITRSDLAALEIGAIPVDAVTSAAEAAVLLGKRVLVDVPAGVPLSKFVVVDEPPLTDSQALIPLQLEKGAIPHGLARGDKVQVIISFPNRGLDAPSPEILAETMEVFDVEIEDEFGDQVNLTLRASPDSAIDLARADRVQVMKVSRQ